MSVRGARLTANTFQRAQDWCAYAKGGSSNVTLTDNVFRDCGTGGYLAGQGSELQYKVAPFLHYEAVGTTVRRKYVPEIPRRGIRRQRRLRQRPAVRPRPYRTCPSSAT